ncbi:hypothetical protein MtrunA17_Chr1g0177311 [Medicago truncatula]|uniref:Transmembrane protein n=1 Tax=Medicago truncatula TaxID=3880 RepID=A0A396JT84_MEDTR|nr:hypothetical protein MtrunA17_Chr1g0177311 [Medicago truncatula]
MNSAEIVSVVLLVFLHFNFIVLLGLKIHYLLLLKITVLEKSFSCQCCIEGSFLKLKTLSWK